MSKLLNSNNKNNKQKLSSSKNKQTNKHQKNSYCVLYFKSYNSWVSETDQLKICYVFNIKLGCEQNSLGKPKKEVSYTSILLSLLGLIAPRSLTFSEVTSRSFRASWVTDAVDVQSYLVQYKPDTDTEVGYISVSVPGDTTTAVLHHLTPVTKYEVKVYAQYEKGESFPLSDFETTLEG